MQSASGNGANAAVPEVPTSKEAGLAQFPGVGLETRCLRPKEHPSRSIDSLERRAGQGALDDAATQKRPARRLGSGNSGTKAGAAQQPLAARWSKDEDSRRWSPIIKARRPTKKRISYCITSCECWLRT